MSNNYKFETLALHVGQEQADAVTDSRAVPIYATTSYVFHNSQHAADRFGLRDAGNIYGRLTNSTQGVFEDRIAALEGGTAGLAVASGAAAITYTIQALAKAGEHIVAQKTIYGGTSNLLAHTLPQYGITATFVDVHNLAEVEAAIQENTKAVYIETLGNPNSDIPDIDAIAELAHKHNLPVVVDNTFGTPYLIRPIEHGADIVVHSATKFIGGHGTTLGGVIVDGGTFDWAASGRYPWISEPNPSYHGVRFTEAAGPAAFATYIRAILLRDEGATISPFAAFLLLQGTETLSLRLDRHVQIDYNALRLTDLRDRLIDGLKRIPYSELNGDAQHRLPSNVNFCFEGIEGESLLLLLDDKGICASSGSACTSGSLDPSHVLLAIGRPHEVAHGSLRLSLGEDITEEQVDYIIQSVTEVVTYLRNMSPFWRDLLTGKRSHVFNEFMEGENR